MGNEIYVQISRIAYERDLKCRERHDLSVFQKFKMLYNKKV